jgi:hypothetical protein
MKEIMEANATKKERREGGAGGGEEAEDDDDKDWMTKECRNMRIGADWPERITKKLLKYTEDRHNI